jgi:hypothetical protein
MRRSASRHNKGWAATEGGELRDHLGRRERALGPSCEGALHGPLHSDDSEQ